MNDLSKQDRQTDDPIIDFEFLVYRKDLGVHPTILQIWRTVHRHWKYSAKQNSGKQYGMRLTGQATTALGNVITNLQCHAEMIKQNK